MKDLGFTVYDFFGYITSGIVFIFAYQLWIFHEIIIPATFTIESGLFYTIGAYIVGHLLSYCSKILFERPLLKKSGPINILLNDPRANKERRVSDYYRPLPEIFRDKIQNNMPFNIGKIGSEGDDKQSGESLLIYLEATLGKDEKVKPRIDVYLSLYGFCRSMSFTLFVIMILIVIGSFLHKWYWDLLWAGVAVGCAWGMYYRYLKFFRLYAKELLVAYAVKGDPSVPKMDLKVKHTF